MRAALVRFAAPAAFLAAATVAILLIRAGLADDSPAAQSPPAATAPATTRPRSSTTPRTTTGGPARGQLTYAIRAGDTLGIVADRYETTVEALVELNPGIDPTALQVGQRIRVK
jgi:LysM repeat protein